MPRHLRLAARRLPLDVSAALVAIALLAACASQGGGSVFSPEEIAAAPAFQRAILEDDEVTWSEYESAVIAERDCLQASGYSPGPLEREGSQLGFVTEVDYTDVADPEAADREFMQTADACREEYTSLVGIAWGEGLVVADPRERESLLQGMVSCLRESGVIVPHGAVLQDVVDLVSDPQVELSDAQRGCLEQYDRIFYVSIQSVD